MDELRKGSELAGTIQAGLLPEDPYIFQDFTCEGSHEACLNVGRDYYDFVPVSEHLLTVTIADVTGHGYPSGLLIVACKFILTTLIEAGIPFDERIDRINRALVKHCEPTQFITFFHAEIDPHTHMMQYCNAGHNTPILVPETDGITEAMNPGGDLYEDERLLKLVRDQRTQSAEDLKITILEDVARFSAGTEHLDDSTLSIVELVR